MGGVEGQKNLQKIMNIANILVNNIGVILYLFYVYCRIKQKIARVTRNQNF